MSDQVHEETFRRYLRRYQSEADLFADEYYADPWLTPSGKVSFPNLRAVATAWAEPGAPALADANGVASATKDDDKKESDAQARFPGDACVFVANLDRAFEAEELEAMLRKMFLRWGNVHPKVKRVSDNNPYGWLQFENIDDARRALKEGNNKMLGSRRIRLEIQSSNRSFAVYRGNGLNFSGPEVVASLSASGEEFTCRALPVEVAEAIHANAGVLVTFTYFERRRNEDKVDQMLPAGYFCTKLDSQVVNSIVSGLPMPAVPIPAARTTGLDVVPMTCLVITNIPQEVTCITKVLIGYQASFIGDVSYCWLSLPWNGARTAVVEYAQPETAARAVPLMTKHNEGKRFEFTLQDSSCREELQRRDDARLQEEAQERAQTLRRQHSRGGTLRRYVNKLTTPMRRR